MSGWCDSRFPPCNCGLEAGHHGMHACSCGQAWTNPNTSEPCTSVGVAVLGALDGPTRLRCGLLDGHDGAHRWAMSWKDEPALPEKESQ